MTNHEIINIEQENKSEAEFMSRNFVENEQKNRAYINALGAEVLVNYLASNGINIGELHNIHSVSKILEKIDISDILLPNIHIDVRVIFDKNYMFIPKSHFNYEITPDIYVFFKLDEKFETVEFIGYIETSKIDLSKENEDYYFAEEKDLYSPDSFINYVNNFSNYKQKDISEQEMLKGRELSVSLSDHDISEKDFKYLLNLLMESDDLRNSLLEFDNFELLSYNASKFISIANSEQEILPKSEDLVLDEKDEDVENDFQEMPYELNEDTEGDTENLEENTTEENSIYEEENFLVEEENEPEVEEQKDTDDINFDIDDLPEISIDDDDMLDTSDIETISEDENTNQNDDFDINAEGLISAGATGAALGAGLLGAEAAQTALNSSDLSVATDEAISLAGMASDLSEFNNDIDNVTNDENNAPEDTFEDLDIDNSDNVETYNPENSYQEQEISDEDLFNQFTEIDEDEIENIANFEENQLDNSEENVINFSDIMDNSNDKIQDNINEDLISKTDIFDEEQNVWQNSRIISNENIIAGEIPIDINTIDKNLSQASQDLENIYNNSNSMQDDSVLQNDVRFVKQNEENNSTKKILTGAVVSLALIGALGFGASKMLNKNQEPEPIVDDYSPENIQKETVQDPNALDVKENNVVSSENYNNSKDDITYSKQAQKLAPTAFIEVSKIGWEVPDYVSYSQDFKQYFQSAGRSLKIALTSDLLLSTEAPYSNLVKVSVSFDKNGSFKKARIVQSSGSAQVDKIVLQTVNETLNVLKAPSSLQNDDNTTAILKIYL